MDENRGDFGRPPGSYAAFNTGEEALQHLLHPGASLSLGDYFRRLLQTAGQAQRAPFLSGSDESATPPVPQADMYPSGERDFGAEALAQARAEAEQDKTGSC